MRLLVLLLSLICWTVGGQTLTGNLFLNGVMPTATGSPVPDLLWYKFGEGSGTTVADSSGNINTGNTGTGVTWCAGKSGSGFGLTNNAGWHQAVQTSANVLQSTPINTVCLWVYPNGWSVVTNQNVLSLGNVNGAGGYSIFTDHSGDLDFEQTDSGAVHIQLRHATTQPGTSGWHHIAVIFDKTSTTGVITYYLDGSVVSTVSDISQILTAGNFVNAHLFVLSGSADTFTLGAAVDDVRIYSYGLTSGQVTKVFNDPQ